MACVLRRGMNQLKLRRLVEEFNAERGSSHDICSVHSIQINNEGVVVRKISRSEYDSILQTVNSSL